MKQSVKNYEKCHFSTVCAFHAIFFFYIYIYIFEFLFAALQFPVNSADAPLPIPVYLLTNWHLAEACVICFQQHAVRI